ncbi:hypothetical protein [Neptuniibacter halophilus]|uniref:hypothetical protein n=1 Tax=Neptuniibacter halophilus TaxID=651666 RepID=UPI002573FF22|nr:hypothetical protein [Neptuniibacter halophilus]
MSVSASVCRLRQLALMPKYWLLILFLQGCQLQPQALQTQEQSCKISPQRLASLQETEKRFLSQPEARSGIMQRAIRDKDNELLALILATPLSSTDQLQQARRHFARLDLSQAPTCPGDRYLDMRNQLTSSLMWMRAEQDNLEAANQALKLKIDALTQIESDLSRQREAQE